MSRGSFSSTAAARKKRAKRRNQEAAKVRGPKVALEEIDYKNTGLLQRMTTMQGKLFSRKRSGLPAPAQRLLAQAIKRARHMALMPYVS